MCGIIGVSSSRGVELLRPLSAWLARLSRIGCGSDSHGIALLVENSVWLYKSLGPPRPTVGRIWASAGIGHVRLATCGRINYANAHPYVNEDGTIFMAHNGTVANHVELRRELKRQGHFFSTELDSEVILHIYEEAESPMEGIKRVVEMCRGSINFVALHTDGTVTAFRGSHFPLYFTRFRSGFIASTRPVFPGKWIKMKIGQVLILRHGKIERGGVIDVPHSGEKLLQYCSVRNTGFGLW